MQYTFPEEHVISTNFKIFYTIHDTYQFIEHKINLRKMLLKKAYKWYLREKVEKVLTVSEFSKNEISKILKVNLDDITVLGNSLGFDKNSYKEIETDSLTSDNKNTS